MEIESLLRVTQNLSVLLVEDEIPLRESMGGFLTKLFSNVYFAEDGVQGIAQFEKYRPDIIISDIMMPNMNGITMLESIKKSFNEQPFLFISAFTETNYLLDAIRLGASGYIIKPVDYRQFLSALHSVCTTIDSLRKNVEYKNHLESMVKSQTEEIVENYEKTILSLVSLVEQRDTYTAGHSQRVALYSKAIAEALGIEKSTCELLYQAGILHDIGKIGTPDAILLKPSKLTSLERSLAEQHVSNGNAILSVIPMYRILAPIVASHHERWNGKGYPSQLKGEDIPFLSRIMMIADTFDAMTSSRIYKPAKTVKNALDEIRSLSGIDFDPCLVKVACDVLEKHFVADEFSQHRHDILSIERLAYYFKDQITGALNIDYLSYISKHNPNKEIYSSACFINLEGIDQINTLLGRRKGDEFLQQFADLLSKMYPKSTLFRPYGTTFIQLCPEGSCPVDKKQTIDQQPLLKNNNITIHYTKYPLTKENGILEHLYDYLISGSNMQNSQDLIKP